MPAYSYTLEVGYQGEATDLAGYDEEQAKNAIVDRISSAAMVDSIHAWALKLTEDPTVAALPAYREEGGYSYRGTLQVSGRQTSETSLTIEEATELVTTTVLNALTAIGVDCHLLDDGCSVELEPVHFEFSVTITGTAQLPDVADADAAAQRIQNALHITLGAGEWLEISNGWLYSQVGDATATAQS